MLDSFKNNQPQLWQQIKYAESLGLIYVDESLDAITPTNRLLMTYPGLHAALCTIINDWNEERAPSNLSILQQRTKEE